MVWSSAKLSFHEIDSEDFAEDVLVLSSLRSSKSQPDATKSCLLIYCLQVLPKEDMHTESKMKCTREVVALDKGVGFGDGESRTTGLVFSFVRHLQGIVKFAFVVHASHVFS